MHADIVPQTGPDGYKKLAGVNAVSRGADGTDASPGTAFRGVPKKGDATAVHDVV